MKIFFLGKQFYEICLLQSWYSFTVKNLCNFTLELAEHLAPMAVLRPEQQQEFLEGPAHGRSSYCGFSPPCEATEIHV